MSDLDRDVETVRNLLPYAAHGRNALDRLVEEVKQSAYYRECRDKWRDQAESLVARIQRLEQERDEAWEELSQALARGRKLSTKTEKYRDRIHQLEAALRDIERLGWGRIKSIAQVALADERPEWHWRDNE